MTDKLTIREIDRALDRVPLGETMAIAFGAALAFALYAMPGVAGGVRALLVLAGAAVGGGAVYALFAWLDASRPKRLLAITSRFAPPRLRRADAHPDAPARRPIFARADLGAPLDEAPEPVWRDDARHSAAVEGRGDAASPLDPAGQAEGGPEVAALSAAQLADRLEEGLRRRDGPVAAPGPALHDAFQRLHARG